MTKVKDFAVFEVWSTNSSSKTVQDNPLCRACLGKHGRRTCKSQANCTFEGCQQRHHQLLHSQTQTHQLSADRKACKQTKPTTEEVNAQPYDRKIDVVRNSPCTAFLERYVMVEALVSWTTARR